ncbi:hypothetical protein ECDEC1D_0991 [Escherichia coli DEC1D]|nr:hypothetical protein ECDEC1D_0991 [Escherichia coli DEC1D]
MLMNARFFKQKIYQFPNKINSIFYQFCIHHCFVMINYKNEFCYPDIKNSNINVLIAIFIDFNQHSLVIYSAYFSLIFRDFLLFTLGPGDRKNYADIH